MSDRISLGGALKGLIDCIEYFAMRAQVMEEHKKRGMDLHGLVYMLYKELNNACIHCGRGCAYAERVDYGEIYYENPKAQAVDAVRCVISSIARGLSLMLYNIHLKLNAIERKENIERQDVESIIHEIVSAINIMLKDVDREVKVLKQIADKV